MKRFAIYPNEVVSPNDGDVHHIGFRALCDLHGVDPREAVDMSRPESRLGVDANTLLPLRVYRNGGGYWPVSEVERRQYPLVAR